VFLTGIALINTSKLTDKENLLFGLLPENLKTEKKLSCPFTFYEVT
jgi:hypothetical protein